MEIRKDILDIIQTELDAFQIQVEFNRKIRPKLSALDRSAVRILKELYEKGPLSISALADTFHLDISTVSRQIAALNTKGYLERIPDLSDGRVDLLEITPSGRTQFNEVKQALREIYNEALADWSEEDRQNFAQYLNRLNRTLVAQRLKLKSES